MVISVSVVMMLQIWYLGLSQFLLPVDTTHASNVLIKQWLKNSEITVNQRRLHIHLMSHQFVRTDNQRI